MKKIIKYFLLLLMIVTIGGCNSKKISNDFEGNYREVDSIDSLTYNVEESIKNLDAFSFEMLVNVDEKEYLIEGKVIVGETLSESTIQLKYKDINLYIKDEEVYISHYRNDTNIIVKDSLNSFIKELSSSLESKGIFISEEEIYGVINGLSFEFINLSFLKEMEYHLIDEKYILSKEGIEVVVNDHYLPEVISGDLIVASITMKFDYNDISITVPIGYNFFTLSISEIKDSLEIETLGDLIKQ